MSVASDRGDSPGTSGEIFLPFSRPVRTALVKFEPRIDVLEVETETQGENLLLIRINYRIRANNAIGNLVYPFYIREAA